MKVALVVLLVLLAVAGIIAAAIHDARRRKKRQDDLQDLANQLGWTFDPMHDSDHDGEFRHFEVFRQGHGRSAYNTLTGSLETDGRSFPVKMGDFTYKITTSTGKTTTTATYNLSYVILELPFVGVPSLLIRREGVFDKLKGAFGFDDIDFESEEFSRRFHVSSADKRFAYDVVHPGMMEFLMQGQKRRVELEQGQCCLNEQNQTWTPGEFLAELDWLRAFFDLWPEHLTRELAERTKEARG